MSRRHTNFFMDLPVCPEYRGNGGMNKRPRVMLIQVTSRWGGNGGHGGQQSAIRQYTDQKSTYEPIHALSVPVASVKMKL